MREVPPKTNKRRVSIYIQYIKLGEGEVPVGVDWRQDTTKSRLVKMSLSELNGQNVISRVGYDSQDCGKLAECISVISPCVMAMS